MNLKNIFNWKLGNCLYCNKELRNSDTVFGNNITKDLSCASCYYKKVEPKRIELAIKRGIDAIMESKI